MKKILLASVAVVGFAGAASAEVMLSGSAAVGVRSIAAGPTTVYNFVKISISGEVETDVGIKVAVSTSIKNGTNMDLDDVATDDVAAGGNGLATPSFTISGSFGTITMGEEKADHLYDDGQAGDIGYSYTMGGFSIGLVNDVNAAGADVRNSFKLGYSADPLSITVTGDDTNRNKVEVGYTVSGIGLTVASDEHDGSSATERTNSIKVAYSANGLSASLKYAKGIPAQTKTTVGLGYSANGLAVNAEFVQPEVGTNSWKAYGSYDLGGGVSAVAGANSANNGYLGLTMSF